MPWTDLTFVGCSLLTAAKMTQMQDNFAALAAGEPGAPPLQIDGVSSLAMVHAASGFAGPQVNSFGAVDVASSFRVGGQAGRILVQEEFVNDVGSFGISTTVAFSAYHVGSFTPLFGDSMIEIQAEAAAIVASPVGGAANLQLHLGRDSIVLTSSEFPDEMAHVNSYGTGMANNGIWRVTYRESSPGSGTAVQYKTQVSNGGATTGVRYFRRRTMLIREWK